MELATDLASLALYDIVIYADDSGSMIFEEGGDRINDLKLILGRVAEVGVDIFSYYVFAAAWVQVMGSSASFVLQTLPGQCWYFVFLVSPQHCCV